MADLKRFQRMNQDEDSLTTDSDGGDTLQLEDFGTGQRTLLERKVVLISL